jgi:hypothetical protein
MVLVGATPEQTSARARTRRERKINGNHDIPRRPSIHTNTQLMRSRTALRMIGKQRHRYAERAAQCKCVSVCRLGRRLPREQPAGQCTVPASYTNVARDSSRSNQTLRIATLFTPER